MAKGSSARTAIAGLTIGHHVIVLVTLGLELIAQLPNQARPGACPGGDTGSRRYFQCAISCIEPNDTGGISGNPRGPGERPAPGDANLGCFFESLARMVRDRRLGPWTQTYGTCAPRADKVTARSGSGEALFAICVSPSTGLGQKNSPGCVKPRQRRMHVVLDRRLAIRSWCRTFMPPPEELRCGQHSPFERAPWFHDVSKGS